jgi:hypothetical protein
MSKWLADILRRPFRPLAVVVILALTPKCLVCVAAYAGIGALLGFSGPEVCGAAIGSPGPWASPLVVFGGALGIAGWIGSIYCRGNRSAKGVRREACQAPRARIFHSLRHGNDHLSIDGSYGGVRQRLCRLKQNRPSEKKPCDRSD